MRLFAGLVLGVGVVVLLGTLALRAAIGTGVAWFVNGMGRPARDQKPSNPFTDTD